MYEKNELKEQGSNEMKEQGSNEIKGQGWNELLSGMEKFALKEGKNTLRPCMCLMIILSTLVSQKFLGETKTIK